MSVKIALLKSGENVIADIKELISEETIVGYLFEDPHRIEYIDQIVLTEDSGGHNDVQLSLIPWIVFSKDKQVPVRPDWIVTVVEPIDEIKTMYLERNDKSETNSINEQTDSFIAD
jgi:hypothetical protein